MGYQQGEGGDSRSEASSETAVGRAVSSRGEFGLHHRLGDRADTSLCHPVYRLDPRRYSSFELPLARHLPLRDLASAARPLPFPPLQRPLTHYIVH